MDKHIIPIQSDLYYLTMFGCRLFCIAHLFGKSAEFVVENRHKLIDIGAIDTQYELLNFNTLVEFFIGAENAKNYKAYFVTISENEIIDNKYVKIDNIDSSRGKVFGILKKYITVLNTGEFKYHWVLQYPDNTEYHTVTTCSAIKQGHIDTKAVMVIYTNNL